MTVHVMKSCVLEYSGTLPMEGKSGTKLCRLLRAGILLGIFLDPKMEAACFFQISVDFHLST
jgi:hypothetical protein